MVWSAVQIWCHRFIQLPAAATAVLLWHSIHDGYIFLEATVIVLQSKERDVKLALDNICTKIDRKSVV